MNRSTHFCIFIIGFLVFTKKITCLQPMKPKCILEFTPDFCTEYSKYSCAHSQKFLYPIKSTGLIGSFSMIIEPVVVMFPGQYDDKTKEILAIIYLITAVILQAFFNFSIKMLFLQDLMAVSMISPLLLPEIMKLGASPSVAGFIISVFGAVQLFSSPIMGKWSDNLGRRTSLIFCLIFIAAGYGLLGCVSTIPLVALARLLLGFCKHSQTMCRAYLCDLSSPNEQTKVLGFFNASSSMGFIVGPTIGGHLAELPAGFFHVCMLAAFLFIFSAGVAQLFLVSLSGEQTVKKKEKSQLESIGVNLNQYWLLFFIRFLLCLAPVLYRNNLSLVALNTFHMSPRHLGYFISFQGLASATCGFGIGLITRFYSSSHKLTLHFAFLMCLSFLGLSFCTTVTLLLLWSLPLNLSMVVCRVSVTKQLVDKTKPEHRGALLGMSQSVTSSARMVGPILAGFLQEVSDGAPVFLSSLFCFSAFLILLAPAWKKTPTLTIRKD